MRHTQGIGITIGLAATLVAAAAGPSLLVDRSVAFAQGQGLPNPYRIEDGWTKLPNGRPTGSVGKVGIAPDGVHIWAVIRCEPLYEQSRFGDECRDSKTDPIYLFNPQGNVVRSFGGGMFIWPHGLTVDPDGNIWVTDAVAPNRTPKGDKRGQIVVKFSPEGKVLMTLGTPGEAGSDNAHFNAPSDVAIGANGDIFVADGHGDNNNRVMKFSKDGKFIKSWGKTGGDVGEFHTLHAIAIDDAGRVFVGDRGNNRIQIFDQDGNILTTPWTQFGKPSGIFFDTKGQIYVADSESDAVQNPGWDLGIRIGDAKTGWVHSFVPFLWGDPRKSLGSGAEFVAVDKDGNMYGGEPVPKRLQKYFRVRP